MGELGVYESIKIKRV